MSPKPQENAKAKRPKKPTIAETRKQMAESGDVDGLWQIRATTPWSLLDGEETFRLLLQAIEVQSARDPTKFAAALFARMVGFTSYLLYRTHHYISSAFANADRDHRGKGSHPFSREVDIYLPRLLELQGHVAELVQAQASTTRLWELARQRRRENDEAEGSTRIPRPRQKAVPGPKDGNAEA